MTDTMKDSTDPQTGLSSAEVEESRRKFGRNVLTPPKKASLLVKFLSQFLDPLILILLAALLLSCGISLYEVVAANEGVSAFFEPMGIFTAILLATGLSFLFEERAGRAFDLLNQVQDDEGVEVIRDGASRKVPRRDIVVGDIVALTTGCEVPADGTLLSAASLGIDESSLTGEPMCRKTTDESLFDPEATFPSNAVLRGTKVVEGHGLMRVTAVGDATENGKVFQAARIDDSVKTPLNEQLERLAQVISRVSYCLAALVIVGRLISFFGLDPAAVWAATPATQLFAYLLQSLMLAVTLVVVSVPEGLPMAVTLSLAMSMRRMFKAKFLVRKLHACETMGSTTVICTDKTGTLTENRMRVRETFFPALEADKDLIDEGIAVNTTASLGEATEGGREVIGNPTEGALLLWLDGEGRDYKALRESVVKVEELPFSTERKFMATLVESAARSGARTLHVKGAPEVVLKLCDATLSDGEREELRARLVGWQSRALRTLALACRDVPKGEAAISGDALAPAAFKLLGIVAIADPVRADVPQAFGECQRAGIAVKIVTGDTSATACEIARQIGLWTDTDGDEAMITGAAFAELSDDELDRRVKAIKVISRARPLDKKRLVESLQRLGEVVAVTGDGTNDAPALKAAHVGLSMGDGTSVAKEASDVTILDNSFASIVRAVMWGRSLYRNIQRFVLFQMTVNVVACLTVLFGAFFGTRSPLTVTQMLWVNLIMDTFAALAMSSLPPVASVMAEKPRARTSFIISGAMLRDLVVTGVGMTGVLMAILLWGRNGLTATQLTCFFTFFVFLQFWNMFRVRALKSGSILSFADSRTFLMIALVILAGQVLLVTFGGKLFEVVPLACRDWALLLVASAAVVFALGVVNRLVAWVSSRRS